MTEEQTMTSLDSHGITVHRTGSGAPLVLLHCLGVDHHFWDFAAPLGRKFTLLSYDLPGHGITPVPEQPYGIDELSDQLAGIFRANDIGRASVAGISLGGLVAQHFAAHHHDLVDRLVLIDTTPRYTGEMRKMWGLRAATAREQGVSALIDDLLKIWFSADCLAENPSGVQYVRSTLARTSGEGYGLACEALAAADLRLCAPDIRARTLVVCGDDDIPSFLDSARWLASTIRGAKLAWIPGTRHASVLEKPNHAVKLLSEFLS